MLSIHPTIPERRQNFESDSGHEYISISLSEETFMEFKLHHVMVKSDETVKILRYNITIEAPAAVPCYDCNYNYTISGKNKAYLLLPDNPDGDLAIVYSSEQDQQQTITIDTYLQTEDGSLILEHDAVQSTEKR